MGACVLLHFQQIRCVLCLIQDSCWRPGCDHTGNLASHTKALESEEYIAIEKQFIGKKPNTRYLATKLGKKAFQEHIEALEKLIQKNN